MRAKCPTAPKPLPPWVEGPSKEAFWTLPIPNLLEATAGVGDVDVPSDPDAIYRRVVPVKAVDNGCLYANLAVLAAARGLHVPPQQIRVDPRFGVRLGNRRLIPIGRDGTVLIDFAGPPLLPNGDSLYPRYSYSEVLHLTPRFQGRGKEMVAGQIDKEAFRDKIVFIGATAPGLYDLRPSPFSTVNVGVETNASMTDAILQNRFFWQPGPWLRGLLTVAIGLGLGWLLGFQSMLGSTLLALGAGIGYSLVGVWLFSGPRVILPMADPLVTLGLCYSSAMAYRFQSEYRERLRNRAYLDLYVTRQVADRILSDPAAAALGGQRVEISVLFSDIRGFTSMSEAMRPEEVVSILNEYFEKTVPRIMEQEGTLDKYVGDAIMGVWGAPMEQPDHARRAVLAGLGMLAALRELHDSWRERGLPTFNIGIGINSGEAVAGNIGSRKRAQYTVIGDTVNTASRLESLNKEMGTNMIISDATYAQVRDLVEVRPLPPVTVKGKSEPLTVYEVLGLKDAIPEPAVAAGTG
jgi:adenylate cyclase